MALTEAGVFVVAIDGGWRRCVVAMGSPDGEMEKEKEVLFGGAGAAVGDGFGGERTERERERGGREKLEGGGRFG